MSAVQRVPVHPGGGDAAAAHARAQPQRRARWPISWPTRKEVTRVIHPAHHTGVGAERTAKYLPHGQGGLVGFELGGGAEAGRRVHRRAASCSTTWPTSAMRAAWRSIRPARRTRSLTEAEQVATGVTPGYVRLSVGHRAYRRHPRRSDAGAGCGEPGRGEARGRLRRPSRAIDRHRLTFDAAGPNTNVRSALSVASASSSIVLRVAPSVTSASARPRASTQVPHKQDASLPACLDAAQHARCSARNPRASSDRRASMTASPIIAHQGNYDLREIMTSADGVPFSILCASRRAL